jgi:hypothetical protein
MNEKESFIERIDNYREIYDKKNKSKTQFNLEEAGKTKEERKVEIEEVKREFEGTGIIEAFEAIRDQEMLVFSKLDDYYWADDPYVEGRVDLVDIIPAKIKYSNGGHNDSKGQISLLFDVEYRKGDEYTKPSYGYHALNINKIDDNKFIYWVYKPNERKDTTIVTGDKEDMISFIAWFVVENTPYSYAYEKDGHVGYTNESVHYLSDQLDKEIN